MRRRIGGMGEERREGDRLKEEEGIGDWEENRGEKDWEEESIGREEE